MICTRLIDKDWGIGLDSWIHELICGRDGECPAVFQTLGQGVVVVIALRDAAGYAGIGVLRWS